MVVIQTFSPSELNITSFKELLPQFFEQILFDFYVIKKNTKSGNYQNIKQASHKNKGSAATYSATLLFAKSKLLEETIDC